MLRALQEETPVEVTRESSSKMSAKAGEDEKMVGTPSKIEHRDGKKGWLATNKTKALVILVVFILLLIVCIIIGVSLSKSKPSKVEASGKIPLFNLHR